MARHNWDRIKMRPLVSDESYNAAPPHVRALIDKAEARVVLGGELRRDAGPSITIGVSLELNAAWRAVEHAAGVVR